MNATFEERIQELDHFRKGNGHCRVPLRQPGLGRWVGEMRQLYKNVQQGATDTVLTEANIALLESMNFEWSVGKPMVPWEQRFQDMIKYKEVHGHCNVPRSYKEDREYNTTRHASTLVLCLDAQHPFSPSKCPLLKTR